MKKSVILLLVISLVAGCGKGKQLVSPLDPPAGTQSGSETQSEETTEKQQEETKCSWLQWGPTKFVAKWTLIAAAAYGLYKLTRYVLGEENWNSIMKKLRGGPQQNANQQPAGQQNQAAMDNDEGIAYTDEDYIDDDEYSSGGAYTPMQCKLRGEGIDYSILNERRVIEAKIRGDMPPVLYVNVPPSEEGKPTRLVSKNGNILKIGHEDQYKVHWEVYKERNYPWPELFR
jgi:hypothetical protein